MTLGFKDQFVPFVEDGSKTHSIRAGERWKVGMRADLFARPRQKGMRLLFRAMVVKVESIEIAIRENLPCLTIDGQTLSLDEADAFFRRDGFRLPDSHPKMWGALWRNYVHLSQAMEFWVRTHRLAEKPFRGQIIHWNYEQRFTVVGKDGGPDLGRDSGKSRELQAREMSACDIAVSDTRERLCEERRTVIRRDSRERPA